MLNQNSSVDLDELFPATENNTNSANDEKFPTVGLKSLLQNSELLELLLKPLSSLNDDDTNFIKNNTNNTNNNNYNGSLFSTNSDLKSKSLFDFENCVDYFDCKLK
jgi:hypothetical protein